ncbi:uncharacterized protein EAF02_001947 [Botrytis sinoallii]|uniref:uncharacterized protein n=1 Tax=Botrytis sinoallii TaxID=1463999 RepID=UPI0018FFBEC5|nr:uncharacterized protein EAF02_001947 [Botrytis sinoallii]KAF7889532.1 hypothetical protein EAF02_001947 [Botrytis sinoallii]
MYHNGTGANSSLSSIPSTNSVSSSVQSGVIASSISSSWSSSALVSLTSSTSNSSTIDTRSSTPSAISSVAPFPSNDYPSIRTSTTPSVGNTATLEFASIGCFNDPAGKPYEGLNLPKFFSKDSMSPKLCISSALAQVTAQIPSPTYKYIALEYGRECYAGSVPPTPEPSSLTGAHAYTMTCKGDFKQNCGGPNMYDF